MLTSMASSLAALVLISFHLLAFPTEAAKVGSCPDNVYEVNFDEKYSESLKEGCRDKFRDLESERPKPKHRERPEQKFNTEYIENCTFGLEQFSNCDSNPDNKPCSDGTTPRILIIRYSDGDRDGDIYDTRLVCPEDKIDLPENLIREIVITPDHFRRYPIAGSILNSAPKGFSLVNGYTHMWASSESQTFRDEIDGQRVTIRAIPVLWKWSYGDGSTKTLEMPGNPKPDHTLRQPTPTSHVYKDTGVHTVSLSTIYRGEFRVGEGQWQAVGGQAAVPSEPISIDVWRTEKELIATE